MTTYHDLKPSTYLKGAPIEGFREKLSFADDLDVTSMTSSSVDLTGNNLKKDSDAINNPGGTPDNKVSNPHGYGYVPSLIEMRNQDATDILAQESTNFALGAVAGVSLIVLGIIMTSVSNNMPST
jgi:hypothetical protein